MSDVTNQALEAAETPPNSAGEVVPQPTSSKRFVVALVALYLGAYVPAVGMGTVAWPLIVARLEPGDKTLWLSVVTGVYALVNVIGTPVAGVLSDRCTSRLGMRRPFIIVGVLFSVIGLGIMAISGSILVLLLGVILQGIGNAAITGAANALVPDQVPAHLRGRIQGVIMVCIVSSGVLAAIFLPLFASNQLALFGAPALLMLVAAVFANIVLHDRHLSRAEARAMKRPANFLREFRIDPRTIPDYSWAWVGKFIVILSTVLTSTFGIYVLTDQLGVSAKDLPGLITVTGLVGLLTAILGAVGGSVISDKLRKRKSLVFGTTILMAVGALVVAFSPSVPVYLVGLVILGLGSGAYSPLDGALFIDVLPGNGTQSGKYMSLMTVADQIPRSFGPILGSAIVAIGALTSLGGYSLMYIVGALIAILGGLTVRRIKGSI